MRKNKPVYMVDGELALGNRKGCNRDESNI
jgi:hypothetical protein